ncbi:MAG: formate dehydrogenase accessory sulfurtransferase FdhD [Chloroflexi bacterium]|nr:formate dehydrogenase accessory sulfurtransferase FdhD [Chloroflexota bacterium]
MLTEQGSIQAEDITVQLPIKRVTEEGKTDAEDLVIREIPLTIILNNRELVTLLCSPGDMRYLAIGFLSSEGLIESKDEIKKLTLDDRRGVVRVETREDKASTDEVFKRFITSACGRGASFYSSADVTNRSKVQSKISVSASQIFALAKKFQLSSETYRATGGVHSAALCNNDEILVFAEDIGRHNAIDKIFGRCLMNGISTDDRMIITSGRIASEILLKVARRNIPVLISKSAPTELGVRLANDFGITLIGFVRGKRMNVYTNDWRVVTDG